MANPPEKLEIRLLGELQLVRGGARLELPASKKTRALLGYLIATKRPHTRAQLCELFWDAPDDPRAALRWSLTKIRPLVDDAETKRLIADRERISFEGVGAEIDLDRIRRGLGHGIESASLEALSEMAETFRGELLDGLDMPDSYSYREWWLGERELLRGKRIEILTALVGRLAGAPESALFIARQRVAIDPLSEAGHMDVIRLLTELGRTKEAIAQYDACRRILDQELRARPSPELERARFSITSAPTPPAAAPPIPRAVARIPFVGREREQRRIESLLDRWSTGSPGAVVLALGVPGIGKSRLLEELAEAAERRGGRVLRARAFEAEMVRPYGPWIDAFRSIALDSGRDELRSDLGGLLPDLTPGTLEGGGLDRNRLFDAVANFLIELAARGPLAVVLDDIQWLDEASVALVHFASRVIEERGAHILLALGSRTGELADNPPALRLIRALARERRLEQLDLPPLEPEHIAAIARSVDPQIDPAPVLEESRGNPFFAIEIARAYERGAQPADMDQLILDRFDHLSDHTRDFLSWAAALGRNFELDLLVNAQGSAPQVVLGAVEELEKHGILQAARGPGGREGYYDFVHDLVRRAAYRRLSEPRRRLVHLRIARALTPSIERDRAVAGDVAHHAALGGDDELAARACIQAGERCLVLFAFEEAAELARRGLNHVQQLPQEVRLQMQVSLLRLYLNPSVDAARTRAIDAELERTIAEAQSVGLASVVASAFILRMFLNWWRGDLESAWSSSYKLAHSGRGTDPFQEVKSIAGAANCMAQIEKDLSRAVALLSEASRIAERERIDVYELYWASGNVAYATDQHSAAIPFFERSISMVKGDMFAWPAWEALMKLVLIELENVRYPKALERARDAIALASKLGEGSELPLSEALEALARLGCREPGAEEEVELKMLRLERIDARAMYAYALATQAEIELARGAVVAARGHAERALEEAASVGRKSEEVWAHVLLARCAMQVPDGVGVAHHLRAAEEGVENPHCVRARVRTIVSSLKEDLCRT